LMHAASRALPLAFGTLFVVLVVQAQPQALPPIFAPRTEPAVVSAGSARAIPQASDRVHAWIAQRVLFDAKAFDAPTPPATAGTVAAAMAGDTVMMERLVVKSSSIRVIELPRPDPPLLNFLKRGTLYHHLGQKSKRIFP
ncbi:MAG: hypothetical protein ABIR80_09265, partial [Opitutaceae bacterium]